MGIPVLVGCKGLKEIENREVVFLNAVEGYAKCAMSGEELIQAQQNVREYQKKVEELQIYKKRPAVTKDGKMCIRDREGIFSKAGETSVHYCNYYRSHFNDHPCLAASVSGRYNFRLEQMYDAAVYDYRGSNVCEFKVE